MPSVEHLSGLQELTLMAVVGLGSDAYSVSIQMKVERDARRTMALGAVYAALDRLERRGYVTSTIGDATPQRGGRRKRMFAVTAAGLRVLHAAHRTHERPWRTVAAATGTKR
jgi:PadR family transcriptional regulator PadR